MWRAAQSQSFVQLRKDQCLKREVMLGKQGGHEIMANQPTPPNVPPL